MEEGGIKLRGGRLVVGIGKSKDGEAEGEGRGGKVK